MRALAFRAAALAILVAGAVHLYLWADAGYRSIHVIGPLFLLNGISAAAIALLLLVWPRTLAALLGLGYAATTLAAFLASVYIGLFGFTEVLNGTAQLVAGIAEIVAIATLTGGSLVPGIQRFASVSDRATEGERGEEQEPDANLARRRRARAA
jgi:hypothetical protein